MSIFARLIKRIYPLQSRFQLQKVPTSKMGDLSTEAYEALIVFETQVPVPIDLSVYRAESKEAA